ncbi:MAG: antitoxin family protein [Chloroflexi bacterium]|nr:antitoxin family protein [Chloroflexota bacterium]
MKTVYKKKSGVKKPRTVKDTHGLYSAKASAKTQVIEAVYDGRVFLPQQSPMLKANTRVRITVEQVKAKRTRKKSFLETARTIKINAPADFSTNVDEYLYQGKSFDAG